jgi:hypothetical protein
MISPQCASGAKLRTRTSSIPGCLAAERKRVRRRLLRFRPRRAAAVPAAQHVHLAPGLEIGDRLRGCRPRAVHAVSTGAGSVKPTVRPASRFAAVVSTSTRGPAPPECEEARHGPRTEAANATSAATWAGGSATIAARTGVPKSKNHHALIGACHLHPVIENYSWVVCIDAPDVETRSPAPRCGATARDLPTEARPTSACAPTTAAAIRHPSGATPASNSASASNEPDPTGLRVSPCSPLCQHGSLVQPPPATQHRESLTLKRWDNSARHRA